MTDVRLPRPGWQQDAACSDVNTEMFFDDSRAGIAEAQTICFGCPVREDCLAAALRVPFSDDFGVWGGLPRYQRNELRKRLAGQGKLWVADHARRDLPGSEAERERGGRPTEVARWLPYAPPKRDLARASA